MLNIIKKKYIFIIIFLNLLSINSCILLKDNKIYEKNDYFEISEQTLINKAEVTYKKGHFDEAAELFQQIKDRYPYSHHSLIIDLQIGDAYSNAKRYDEAILAYEEFIRLHPKNEKVPYAIYKIGIAYYNQILSIDRDQTNTRKAAEFFQRLIYEYPNSEWAKKAQFNFKESLKKLANQDLIIGQYYYQTQHYDAAIERFKKILTQYPDIGIYNEAIKNIILAQNAINSLTKNLNKQYNLSTKPLVIDSPTIFEDIKR